MTATRCPRNGSNDSTYYDPASNVTRTRSTGGSEVTFTYDAGNQLTQRTTGARSDPQQMCAGFPTNSGYTGATCAMYFPAFPNAPGGTYTVATDVATFTYDPTGNLRTADNGDAKVHRTYFRSGALRTDSSGYRAVSGPMFDTWFTAATRYDLAGRRRATILTNGDSIAYSYRVGDGLLLTVTDPTAATYRYRYTPAGRVDSLVLGTGVRERRAYDADGRQTFRERRGAGFTNPLSSETLRFDAQGRITEAAYSTLANLSAPSTTYLSYAGLGAVLASERVEQYAWEVEEFRVDAQGNVRRSRATNSSLLGMPQTSTYTGRGALTARAALFDAAHPQAGDDLTQGVDADGQGVWTARVVHDNGGAETGSTFTRSHYGADGKLHASTRYRFLGSSRGGAWEEYRYDALGRRVLVLARAGVPQACLDANASGCVALCAGVNGCVDGVTRTQWAGDRILSETRDTLAGPFFPERYGTITYVHGLDLDHPLALLDSKVAGAQLPNPNWRGLYESSVTPAGVAADCSLNGSLCATRNLAFPAGHSIYLRSVPAEQGSTYAYAWAGSLVTDQQDATGTLYRRNRYYDAATGRFTQEDPIGLAGGTNLYGFANADPINFSDPFGLCPICDIADVGFFLYSAGRAIFNPTGENLENLALDAVGLLPIVPSAGLVRRVDDLIDGARDSKRVFSRADRAAGLEKARDARGVPRCEYCGTELNPKAGRPNSYEADHRKAHSKGGRSSQDNLAPSCRTCNRSKRNQDADEFRKRKQGGGE